MKKSNIINLIKYHMEKNDFQFRNEATEIARYFDQVGDYELAEYIVSLLSDNNKFYPQSDEMDNNFLEKVIINNTPLPLPTEISDDIKGVINAINHKVGMNKYLFEGAPGTGKTETVKQIARLLDRTLYMVNFNTLIDSKLGQTAKNIQNVFLDVNRFPQAQKVIVLFDEIDAIALDRINSNDIREMGRVTSTILKELDKLNDDVVLIATTNLYEKFDKALIRRFNSVISFNRYSKDNLIDIAESILNELFKKFKFAGRNTKLFRKILNLSDSIPYPGELTNLIKTSLAFSDPNNEFDYLIRILKSIVGEIPSIKYLSNKGFSLREIEILTGVSKSQASRELKGD